MNDLEKEEANIIKDEVRKKIKVEHKTFFIDIETGGLNPYTDGICEISIKELGQNYTKTWLIYPYKKVYYQMAFDVNNLDLKTLYTGDSLRMVLRDLLSRLGASCTLIGYFVEFDIKFLLQAIKEQQLNPPLIHAICVKNMAQKKLTKKTRTNNGQVEDFKQTTIYQYFNNDFCEDLAHTSSYDVAMCENLYKKLKD